MAPGRSGELCCLKRGSGPLPDPFTPPYPTVKPIDPIRKISRFCMPLGVPVLVRFYQDAEADYLS